MLNIDTARLAVALPLLRVLRDIKLDIESVFDEAGWDAGLVLDPDRVMPVACLGRLLAVAAERGALPHIGLLVAERAGVAALGAVGFAVRNAPTVRAALRLLVELLGRHDRGGTVMVSLDASGPALTYRLSDPLLRGADHIADLEVAVGSSLMRELCGPQWRPVEVCFAHRRPADAGPYQAFFRAPLRFDAEATALTLDPACLDQAVVGADPELRRVLMQAIRAASPSGMPGPADEIRRVLLSLIGHGGASQEAVARAFGLSTRTLHRRLAAAGTSFQELLDEVRIGLGCRLLSDTALSASQIALMLDYSEASAFTRAFKRRLGRSPSAWRAAEGIPAHGLQSHGVPLPKPTVPTA